MNEQELAQLTAFKHVARGQVIVELGQGNQKLASRMAVVEIDEGTVAAYERWHPNNYDFGWDRVPRWKTNPAHARALDIAVWYENQLAGLCWATPQNSNDKIMVLYLQRNPDADLPTRGRIAPICLSSVRYYALMLGLRWVVIKDPLPEARQAYLRDGFRQVRGVGLAYDLASSYAAINSEEFGNGD
jgi:hypothetical protein